MTFPFRSSGGPRRLLTSASVAVTVVGTSFFVVTPAASAAQAPVGLGTATSFAVLAGAGITNTGPTSITGDVGSFPTPAQTGFGSVTLIGTNHAADAVTQGAKDDLVTAYNDAAGRTPVTNLPVELGNSLLPPGVYTSPTFGLTGTLTLDAQGDTDAQFIFLAGSTLITAADSRVVLLNGADPCRVVWQVGSSATFDTRTQFVGDVLALESISALTSASFQGRLLARNGAVTLDTNTITNVSCTAPSGGPAATATGGLTPASNGTTSAAIPTTPDTTVGAGVSTPSATPTPVPSARPPRTTTGAPGSPSGPPALAHTGPLVGRLTWTGMALLGLGTLVLCSGRRRKSPTTPDEGIDHDVETPTEGPAGKKSASEVVAEAKASIENLNVDAVEAEELTANGSIPGSVHLPRGMLEFYADPTSPYHREPLDSSKRVILHCASGGRSALAASTLRQVGYEKVAQPCGPST